MLFVGTSIIHPSTEGVFLLCNILDLLIYSYSNKRNGCSPYHNGNIIAEEIPPELLSYMEEVLPEKKELDTESVLDTMINVNEFLKN